MSHRTKADNRRRRGVTLVECLIATSVLAIATIAVMRTSVAGARHLAQAETRLAGVRLAEALLEEVVASPLGAPGDPGRRGWGIDDFDGLCESPGDLRGFDGALLGDDDQVFTRCVGVTSVGQVLPDLGGALIAAREIEVVVTSASGDAWRVTRIEPY